MLQVRKACLMTLEKLRAKAHNTNITYLKSRNILPLFYYFLQDVSNEMKAVNYFKHFDANLYKDGLTINLFFWPTRRITFD